MDNNINTRKCLQCGNLFELKINNPNKRKTKYCSTKCNTTANMHRQSAKRKALNIGSQLGLSSGKIGKINEYVVCIDLIKRGYEVFLAFEDTHPFDILAIKYPAQLKIEVKTAQILPSGNIHYAMKKNQELKHDILAIVTNLSTIKYIPALL